MGRAKLSLVVTALTLSAGMAEAADLARSARTSYGVRHGPYRSYAPPIRPACDEDEGPETLGCMQPQIEVSPDYRDARAWRPLTSLQPAYRPPYVQLFTWSHR
jgi:hypothetical protein